MIYISASGKYMQYSDIKKKKKKKKKKPGNEMHNLDEVAKQQTPSDRQRFTLACNYVQNRVLTLEYLEKFDRTNITLKIMAGR